MANYTPPKKKKIEKIHQPSFLFGGKKLHDNPTKPINLAHPSTINNQSQQSDLQGTTLLRM